MTYIGILLGGVAGFLYWKFVGCTSGACPITSNKYISIIYGAVLGSLLLSTVAGSTTKEGFFKKFFGKDSVSTYQQMDAEVLAGMADDENTVIIDVRTPAEWQNGYIPGTDMFIDFQASDFADQISKLDTSKTYVIYCRSGNRSSKACQVMSKNGFTKLYNLSGGINKWTGEIKKD
jgi:rhodanese-related sulfurtransferase